MRLRHANSIRTATASVEFAVVLSTVLVPLMLGTWEVGRLVQVQQILDEATREGARIAAQGRIINLKGTYTEVVVSDTDPNNPDVVSAVKNHLNAAGISTTGLSVTFNFLDSSGNTVASPTMPYQGTKGQPFRVTASLPYTSFRWTTTNMFNITQAKSTIDWVSMIDDPFTVNTTLPSWTGY
ncbi:MAG: TadE family protein [Gemmataceae bacterium]